MKEELGNVPSALRWWRRAGDEWMIRKVKRANGEAPHERMRQNTNGIHRVPDSQKLLAFPVPWCAGRSADRRG